MVYVIIAFLIGFYLGNSSQRREDIKKITEIKKKVSGENKYKVIKKSPKED